MTSRFSVASNNILSVQGNLDVYSVAEAIKQGSKLLKSNDSFEVIDLQQVNNMDSAGLAFVIELLKTSKYQKKNLRFKNIPNRMLAVAKVYGLSKIIPAEAFQSA